MELLEDRIVPAVSLVQDINLGTQSSNPSAAVTVGSEAYFTANDGVHGVQLYETDGTSDGTVRINPLGAISNPSDLTAVGNQLYFVNGDGTLWTANGTTATLVSPSNGSFNQLSDLTAVGNQLYFTSSYFFNPQLWVASGTTATQLTGASAR